MYHRDYKSLSEFIRQGRSKQERKIENNTIVRFVDDHVIVKLHSTDIVELYPDNTLILNSGGYKTNTTKARINEFLPVGIVLYQEGGLWYLSHVPSWQDKIPFVDGIMINPDLSVVGSHDDRQEIKLRKDIKKYAKGFITALLKGKVESPNGGDCWDCYMREINSNKPLGEFNNDTSHLLEHFSEKYYVGSLLARAIEVYPISLMGNSVLWDLWLHDNKPGNMSWILETQAYKSLVKYLYQHFNLPY